MKNSRRDFLKKGSLLGLGLASVSGSGIASGIWQAEDHIPTFKLPDLPYSYDALEPFIDKMTMEIHHSKHHAGYVNNLNNAIKGEKHFADNLLEVFSEMERYPASVRNNAGGHWNHTFFWQILRPGRDENMPIGNLKNALEKEFGSLAEFKTAFKKEALARFGSGWAWLVKMEDNSLKIISTANQDNPHMFKNAGKPIIGIDVWEHAYYLKYQNKRADYIDNFWSILNWDQAEVHFNS